MRHTPWTIDDIKTANNIRGMHWFEPATLRFFRSRVHDEVYEGPGGIFFVSSEQFVDGRDYAARRLYSVRRFNPETGAISTVGDFQNFKSRSGAHSAAKKLSEGR